jgi:hypothetical protein
LPQAARALDTLMLISAMRRLKLFAACPKSAKTEDDAAALSLRVGNFLNERISET